MGARSICATVAAVVLSVLVFGAGAAHAAGPLTGTKVRNWQTGFVLSVAGGSTVGGAQIHYQTDTDDLSQFWAVEPVTTDTFLLRNLNSDMCVTAIAGGASEPLQQRPCDVRWREQVFSLEESSTPSRHLLRNLAHGSCLHPYAGTANTFARLYACTATTTWQMHSFDVR